METGSLPEEVGVTLEDVRSTLVSLVVPELWSSENLLEETPTPEGNKDNTFGVS